MVSLTKKILSRLGKYLIPIALSATLNNSCLECPVPDNSARVTPPVTNQKLDDTVKRLYNYLDLQLEGQKVGSEFINPQQYLEDIGGITAFLVKKFEQDNLLSLRDIFQITINSSNEKNKFIRLAEGNTFILGGFFEPNCDQVFINLNFAATYGFPDSTICDLHHTLHEIGHYFDNGRYPRETVSMFFENVLRLIGYVSISPQIKNNEFKHIFQLSPAYNCSRRGPLTDLRLVIEDDLEKYENWIKNYAVGSYAFFKSLHENEGNFKRSLEWLFKTPEEEIMRLYKASIENKTFCKEMEKAVTHIKDYLLRNTNGGYSFNGINHTQEYINELFKILENCQSLHR